MAKRTTIRIGVFIPADCQLFDAACVDFFGSCSYEYLSCMSSILPKAVLDLAPSVHISWIGTKKAGEAVSVTSTPGIVLTNHYQDPQASPGNFDVILVPGPDPNASFEEGALEWLKKQSQADGTDILSVCSGILICGEAGLLKGKRVSGPRGLQDWIKAKGFGEKELVGHRYRWVQDGSFWSSGGVTNGNDLVVAWCRASPLFPNPIVDLVSELTDVGDRAQIYGKGQTSFTLGMVWILFRSFWAGLWKRS